MNTPKILTKEEIEKELGDLDGWEYKDEKISKEFEFEDFSDGLNFVNKLELFFNNLDHHPDIHIFYNKIRFDLQRFDVGGKVTDKDITIAKKIEENYRDVM